MERQSFARARLDLLNEVSGCSCVCACVCVPVRMSLVSCAVCLPPLPCRSLRRTTSSSEHWTPASHTSAAHSGLVARLAVVHLPAQSPTTATTTHTAPEDEAVAAPWTHQRHPAAMHVRQRGAGER